MGKCGTTDLGGGGRGSGCPGHGETKAVSPSSGAFAAVRVQPVFLCEHS